MKVETESEYKRRKNLIGSIDTQAKFPPIHITVETYDEAQLLWHHFNKGEPFKDYNTMPMHHITLEELKSLEEELGMSMFQSFDRIFSPRRKV